MDDLPIVPFGSVEVEHAQPNATGAGRYFGVVQAHADDAALFCAGTIAKLIAEGWTGYLIQTTNDDKCGPTPSLGDTMVRNERDIAALAEILGLAQVFNLGYRNHFLDGESPLELRARLIFLVRLLKLDLLLTFNPWGPGERNPDHVVTGQAASAAAWMAGMDKDYPEHFAAGLEPHAVQEYYYWAIRGGQVYNRVVDVTAHIDTVVAAMSANKAQGPGGSTGSQLKMRLAAEGRRLPALEGEDGSDEAADRAYVRLFLLEHARELGATYALEYAEPFYCTPPPDTLRIDQYIAQHAIKLQP